MDAVTVCVTYFNEPAETLGRAVASVVAQTQQPCELIIVDDGSRWPEIPAEHSGVARVVRVTNRGLPAARNTALMLAKGDAFLPLDADDWLDPTYIKKTSAVMLREKSDVVCVGLQEHGPTRVGVYKPGYNKHVATITVDDLWRMNLLFYASLIRTETIRQAGGYHPAMAGWPGVKGGFEDWDLWIDLKKRGARFSAVDEVLFHYNTSNPDSMLQQAMRNRDALLTEMHRHHGSDGRWNGR